MCLNKYNTNRAMSIKLFALVKILYVRLHCFSEYTNKLKCLKFKIYL